MKRLALDLAYVWPWGPKPNIHRLVAFSRRQDTTSDADLTSVRLARDDLHANEVGNLHAGKGERWRKLGEREFELRAGRSQGLCPRLITTTASSTSTQPPTNDPSRLYSVHIQRARASLSLPHLALTDESSI